MITNKNSDQSMRIVYNNRMIKIETSYDHNYQGIGLNISLKDFIEKLKIPVEDFIELLPVDSEESLTDFRDSIMLRKQGA